MTCGQVSGFELTQRWDFGLAARFGRRTLRMEVTTTGRMNRRRHIAGKENALALGIGIDDGNGREQRLGVGMLRRTTEFLGLSGLDDAAADVFQHREIVRDEQIRDADALALSSPSNTVRPEVGSISLMLVVSFITPPKN